MFALRFAVPVHAASPEQEFSGVNNPNGVWSYGYTPTLGGALSLYTTPYGPNGLVGWNTNLGSSDPLIVYNGTAAEIAYETLVVEPGELVLHPGPDGEYSVLRFTAPATAIYRVTGLFAGRDQVGTTTDVHLLVKGVSVFDGEVTGFGPDTGPSFDQFVTLAAGDPLDFAIGYGTNGTYFDDATALVATVSPINVVSVAVKGDGEATVGGTQGVVIVSRTGDTTEPLTVFYKVGGNAVEGVDYRTLPGSVTIPAGVAEAKIKIKPIDTGTTEDMLLVKIKLKAVDDDTYSLGSPTVARIPIIDNE